MIEVAIPGRGNYRLEHLVLDLNGTIALDGEVIPGVRERLARLANLLTVSVVTADTHGNAASLKDDLQASLHRIQPGGEEAQKLALVTRLGADRTAAIGNGSNDVSMLKESAIGICVLGGEGAAAGAITAADIVAPDINSALDLLLKPDRLVATLRR